VVALVISNAVDKRATRSALTDLAVKVGKKTKLYQDQQSEIEALKEIEARREVEAGAEIEADKKEKQDIGSKEGDLFARMKEIETLVGQADFLVYRLKPGIFARCIPPLARRPRYPASVTVTFAQALEAVSDSWWADRYWDKAVRTDDEHNRALTYKYWAMALCIRTEYQRGREKAYEAYRAVASQTASDCIFRGDMCAGMMSFDTDRAECWRYVALAEYGKVAKNDALYNMAVSRTKLYGPCSYCDIDAARFDGTGLKLTEDKQAVSDLPCRQIAPESDPIETVEAGATPTDAQ
jgi:hypothetical protein